MNGDWHLISGTPLMGEKLMTKCGKFSLYHEKKDLTVSTSLKFAGLSAEDNQPAVFEAMGQPMYPNKSVTYGVWKKGGSSQWSGIYKQAIVATDYDTFAVFVACRPIFKEDTKTFDRHLIGHIWARESTLKPDVIATLKSILIGYDVDPADIHDIDRSNCS
ncbi:unnamed protein product [Timema podura]|uniref:Lipocalin/cytosolic fatty-acid binding domain-containing protein n=1 Tax=Timema podura TaxID=61482 RepID=A0ABN7PDB0_TIMPD|nr:unnamed protein product [Timema podura]